MELKCSKHCGRLDSAFKEVIGTSGSVRHLIPRIEVEIADIDPSTDAEDVEEAVISLFDHGSKLELEVSLTKRPFRSNGKAYVFLEETWALKLLKATHTKIEWVSCNPQENGGGLVGATTIEILQIESTRHSPLCKWQHQSGNSVRAKERETMGGFFCLCLRVPR